MPTAKKAKKQTRKLAAGKRSESVKPLSKPSISDIHVTKPVDSSSPTILK